MRGSVTDPRFRCATSARRAFYVKLARRTVNQAIAKDPNYAEAYSALAMNYINQDDWFITPRQAPGSFVDPLQLVPLRHRNRRLSIRPSASSFKT